MPLQVLVVEDDAPTRRSLVKFFNHQGYATEEAATNEEGLRVLRRSSVDLITSDLNRGGGSGADLLRELRSDASLSRIPVVIVTGNAPPERELECWRLGARAFLRKPLGPVELLGAIGEILGQNRMRDLFALVDLGAEGRDLEYKRALNLDDTTGRGRFAREVLAMANSGGGHIVVGVAEVGEGQFVPEGIPERELSRYETTRLNDSIRPYLATPIGLQCQIVKRGEQAFAVVRVSEMGDGVALAAVGNENAGIHPGRIYVRGDDARSAELTHPEQLRQLVDRLVESRLDWVRERKNTTGE